MYNYAYGISKLKIGIIICDVISVAPPQPYEPPFFDVVGERPTLEMMKEAVVHGKHRPLILPTWTAHIVSRACLTD